MENLVKLGERTYCLKNRVNIGFYVIDNNTYIIDTGSSVDYGKDIEKVLLENNWNIAGIINTHSHADHISANKYLQDKYNIKIYSSNIENIFINNTFLEPLMFTSSTMSRDMSNHFFKAKESITTSIDELNVEGLSIISLKGHSMDSIGILTSDSVLFVGDAFTSIDIINKYKIQYIYNIEEYLKTLDYLKSTNYTYYIPSHGDILTNITSTIDENIRVVNEVENTIITLIDKGISFSKLLTNLLNYYHIKGSMTQYFLISSILKSYLYLLKENNIIDYTFIDNDFYIIKIIKEIGE